MNSDEFDKVLTEKYKCWLFTPTLFVPGTNKDATIVKPDDFLLIFEKYYASVSTAVRKRSEKYGLWTYYAVVPEGYFKTDVAKPETTLADARSFVFPVKQAFDTIKVRLGQW